ncbi:hypothetical protein ACOME3_009114 [Neoechinorhynchus agilis]
MTNYIPLICITCTISISIAQKFVVIVDFEERDLQTYLTAEHYNFYSKHDVHIVTIDKSKAESGIVQVIRTIQKPTFLLILSKSIYCETIELIVASVSVTVISDACLFYSTDYPRGLVRINPNGNLIAAFLSSFFSSFKWNSFSVFYTASPTYRFSAIGLIADILIKSDIRLTDFGTIFDMVKLRGSSEFSSKIFLYVCNEYDLQNAFKSTLGFTCKPDELHIVINIDQIFLPEVEYAGNCSNIVQLLATDELNNLDEVLLRFNSVFKNDVTPKLQFDDKRAMFHLLASLSHLKGRTSYPNEHIYSYYLNVSSSEKSLKLFNLMIASKKDYHSETNVFFRTIHGIPWRMNQDLWKPPSPEHIYRTCADLRILLWGLLAIFLAITIVCVGIYVIRNNFHRRQMIHGPNRILLLPEDLIFVREKKSIFSNDEKSLKRSFSRGSDICSVGSLRTLRSTLPKSGKRATFNGDNVWVKRLKVPNFTLKGKIIKEFRIFRDLRHENINPFLGCYFSPSQPSLVYEYGHRGSLEDIIRKDEIKLDWNFKWSMLNDLVRGMRYLHHSAVKWHGALKSRNCVVDSRWVLKITDYGLLIVGNYPNKKHNLSDLLWTAPEHLRNTDTREGLTGSQPGDVYSFAIILQEIILRSAPYSMMALSYSEIISKIKKPPPLLRPSVSKQAAPPEYINIMRECWAEQPEIRPTFDDLAQRFKTLNGGRKVNIVDTMFRMLEQYSNNLEELINQRTVQLEEEKKKTEKLLSEMLPPTVSEALKLGQPVPAEQYDCVTIYFSDIVGFTTISALSHPIQVVDLLNDLYTMFDSIVMSYDCYKVETIGDAYMVVSGLPIRNGDNHAAQIAKMALDLLYHCGRFKIAHMPGIPLMLRIGIHSGPVVAGVVGLKMPRYCLFGDTVNTASRMESTSQGYWFIFFETQRKLEFLCHQF